MTDNDELVLRDDTLAALNEFLLERRQYEQQELIDIESKVGKNLHFKEDWQLSQFWYNDETKAILKSVVLRLISEIATVEDCKVALLSCPSLYEPIKDRFNAVTLFEYDKRFSAYGKDFIHYDVNEGDNNEYLKHLHHEFDITICDPPFLSKECIQQIANITKNLLKPNGKIIFCSGATVEPWLCASLPLTKCKFLPRHQSNLCNEFASYANFDLDSYM